MKQKVGMILFYENDFSLVGYVLYISACHQGKEEEMGPVLKELVINWKR